MLLNRKLIVSLVFAVILCSCNSDGKRAGVLNAAYTRSFGVSKSNLPPGLLNHFPQAIYGEFKMTSHYPNNEKYRPYYGSVLMTSITDSELAWASATYSDSAIHIININDSRLIPVNDELLAFVDSVGIGSEQLTIVLPNISALLNSEDGSEEMFNSQEVFIIEHSNDALVDDSYLKAKPKELVFLEHGYSKGIIICEELGYIFYWAIIW